MDGKRHDDVYKVAVLTYKALHGRSPRYLSSLVHVADVSGRPALRSAESNCLRIRDILWCSVCLCLTFVTFFVKKYCLAHINSNKVYFKFIFVS